MVRRTYEFQGDASGMVKYEPAPIKLVKVKVGLLATRSFKFYVLGMAS
jgi:hypothetical protein